MEINKEICGELKTFFRKEGISQTEAAEKLGFSKVYVNAMLCGRVPITKKMAKRLNEFFGLEPKWLLTGEGPQRTSKEAAVPVQAQPLPCSEPEKNPLVDVIRRQQEVIGKQQEMIQTLLKLLPDTRTPNI